MKIAMPYDGGRINEHFGRSSEFAVYTVEGGQVAASRIVSSRELLHNHAGLAGLLKSEGVDVVITGGIGNHMLEALRAMGFTVVTGASGDAAGIARDYAGGSLVTDDIDICGCGHEHAH